MSSPFPSKLLKDEESSSGSESTNKYSTATSSQKPAGCLHQPVDLNRGSISTPVNLVSYPVSACAIPSSANAHVEKPKVQTARKSFKSSFISRTAASPAAAVQPRREDFQEHHANQAGRKVLNPHPGVQVQIRLNNSDLTSLTVTKEKLLEEKSHSSKRQQSPEATQVESDVVVIPEKPTPEMSETSEGFPACASEKETKESNQPIIDRILKDAIGTIAPTSSTYKSMTNNFSSPKKDLSGMPHLMLDDAERKALLDSMKLNHSSPPTLIDVQASTSGRIDDVRIPEDPLEYPSENPPSITGLKNEGVSLDRMPTFVEATDDSYDEELYNLAKKPRNSCVTSKPDLVPRDIENPVYVVTKEKKRESETIENLSVRLSSHNSIKPPTNKKKPQQEIFNLPTPAHTPFNDDKVSVEERMAALHAEKYNIEDEDMRSFANDQEPNESDMSFQLSFDQSDSDQLYKPHSTQKSRKVRKTGPKRKVSSNPAEGKAKEKIAKPGNISREVLRLYQDEGAVNIMREMELRDGDHRRRTVVKKDIKIESTSNIRVPSARGPGRPRRASANVDHEMHGGSATKKNLAASSSFSTFSSSKVDSNDDALHEWKPLQNSKYGKEPVYVPRKMVNPADASKIIHRRSYSSDTSTDGIISNARNNEQSPLGPTLSTYEPVPTYEALKDHGYTIDKKNVESLKAAQWSDGGLATKLGAKCKEIHLRCKDNLLEVILSPVSSKLKNSLNPSMLRELITLLRELKMEPQIHVVLITSAGPAFCTGIDFPCLLIDSLTERQEAAASIANLIQEFITELANCDKHLVAGVSGSAIGLGVTMLPYFDTVYSAEKSTFYLPYVALGQNNEGGVSLTWAYSTALATRMVHHGNRLTATEAEKMGLVHSVLWPKFQESLLPLVLSLASKTSEISLHSKKQLRATLRGLLPDVLKEECWMLQERWISEQFQKRAKQLFASGDLLQF